MTKITNIRAHDRKGTKGVKAHTREIEDKTVPNKTPRSITEYTILDKMNKKIINKMTDKEFKSFLDTLANDKDGVVERTTDSDGNDFYEFRKGKYEYWVIYNKGKGFSTFHYQGIKNENTKDISRKSWTNTFTKTINYHLRSGEVNRFIEQSLPRHVQLKSTFSKDYFSSFNEKELSTNYLLLHIREDDINKGLIESDYIKIRPDIYEIMKNHPYKFRTSYDVPDYMLKKVDKQTFSFYGKDDYQYTCEFNNNEFPSCYKQKLNRKTYLMTDPIYVKPDLFIKKLSERRETND